MGVKHGPTQSSSALTLMHLTCGHYARFWGYHTPAMWRMCKGVRATTGWRPLSHLVTDRRLWLFGHIARSSPQEDHHRAVAAVIRGLPTDWKRPLERPHLASCIGGRPWPTEHWPLILPGGGQLFVTTGGALWTQQRSSSDSHATYGALQMCFDW